MRPQDIEKIANSVVGAFGRPIRASAGCSGVSDPTPFTCANDYTCSQNYVCGGVGLFSCSDDTPFDCTGSFDCGGGWECSGEYTPPGR